MPHLSPLNWILAPLIFWSILLMMTSILWWSQTMKFPKLSSSLSLSLPSIWPW